MTVAEIVDAIEKVGGRVDLVGGQLKVRAPQELIELARAQKADIIRHIEDRRVGYIVRKFRAKLISTPRLRQIEKGGRWRILSGLPRTDRKSWVTGMVCCLGCRGSWHSESGFNAHLLVCPLDGKS